MPLVAFLTSLFDGGRIAVEPNLRSELRSTEKLALLLREYDAIYRRTLPGTPPSFVLESAESAVVTLYRACQCLAYREYSAEDVEREVSMPPPLNPAEHLSVDLICCFLPDVVRLARAAAPDDVLVKRLLTLARDLPLSSIGISGVGEVDTQVLAGDRWIWEFYVERVLERGDTSRMNDPNVRKSVREAVGAHTTLVAKYVKALGFDAIPNAANLS